MSSRITNHDNLGGLVQSMLKLGAPLAGNTIERGIQHLVEIRASQINGCALCLAMHTEAALKHGERIDRLSVISAWRDAPWFSDRERAALAWTEAVTTLEDREVPQDVFDQARAQYSEQELVDLTHVVIVINGWNRLNIAFQSEPAPFTIESKDAVAAD
jgi:AhpD family alkylhydroperoxidase